MQPCFWFIPKPIDLVKTLYIVLSLPEIHLVFSRLCIGYLENTTWISFFLGHPLCFTVQTTLAHTQSAWTSTLSLGSLLILIFRGTMILGWGGLDERSGLDEDGWVRTDGGMILCVCVCVCGRWSFGAGLYLLWGEYLLQDHHTPCNQYWIVYDMKYSWSIVDTSGIHDGNTLYIPSS